MYKDKNEVKKNVEEANRINWWKNNEHKLNTIARRVDKRRGEKPMFYVPQFKY